MGFRNGSRVRPGTVFEIASKKELGKWMEVVEEPKPEPKPRQQKPKPATDKE